MILESSIKLTFTYAAGDTGSAFLHALAEGQILGGHCAACSIVLCPPRSHCPRCQTAITGLMPVGPGGVLRSWTSIPGKGDFGLVLLDGAGTPLLHRLLGGNWTPNVRVRARFAAGRGAHINAIEGFEAEDPP